MEKNWNAHGSARNLEDVEPEAMWNYYGRSSYRVRLGPPPGKTFNTETSSLEYVTCFKNMAFYSGSMKIGLGGQERRLGKEFSTYWNIRGNR